MNVYNFISIQGLCSKYLATTLAEAWTNRVQLYCCITSLDAHCQVIDSSLVSKSSVGLRGQIEEPGQHGRGPSGRLMQWLCISQYKIISGPNWLNVSSVPSIL